MTAKLIKKETTANWTPPSLGDVDPESVKVLFDSKKSELAEGFDIQKIAVTRHASFGLPNEDDVERALGQDQGKGEMGLGQLIEELEFQFKGKHGIRERVEEIVARKARLVDGKVVWNGS